jgi:Asp-tRNA(Asn)/Glu-tRNA(Gln) amidotransferase C subunit
VGRIEPTSQVGSGAVVLLREDRVVPCDVREEALEQAPDRDGDYFRVPRVV